MQNWIYELPKTMRGENHNGYALHARYIRTRAGFYVPQESKCGSLRLAQRSLSANFSILSLASVLTTSKPSSTSVIESTLKQHFSLEFLLITRPAAAAAAQLPKHS